MIVTISQPCIYNLTFVFYYYNTAGNLSFSPEHGRGIFILKIGGGVYTGRFMYLFFNSKKIL